MAKRYRQNASYEEIVNADKFRYDPEGDDENQSKKYRLPFALCKAKNIKIEDWWRPRDAWNALKKYGVVDDVSEEYKEYYRDLKRKQAKERRRERTLRSKARDKQR